MKNTSSIQCADREKPASVYRATDWCAALVTFAVSLSVYVYTLCPTVGMYDEGSLITASYRLGVAYPTGYPTWTMLSKLVSLLVPVGTVAWRVNFFSALCAALAAALVTLVVARSGAMLRDWLASGRKDGAALAFASCAVAAGLLFAFTQSLWTEATTAGTLSFNALHMMVIMACALALIIRPERRGFLYAIAAVFALGVVNYQAFVLMFPSLVVVAFCTMKSPDHFRLKGTAFHIVAIVLQIIGIIVAITMYRLCRYSWDGRSDMPAVTAIGVVFLALIAFIAWAWRKQKRFEWFIMLGMNGLVLLGFAKLMYHFDEISEALGMGRTCLRMMEFDGWPPLQNFFVVFILPFVLYLVVSHVVNKLLFNDTAWTRLTAALFAGLATYLYLPLASWTNPQVNWCQARGAAGLWNAIRWGWYGQPTFGRPL